MRACLISVIDTSSGDGTAFVKEDFTNMRIGMLLEIATTVGARQDGKGSYEGR